MIQVTGLEIAWRHKLSLCSLLTIYIFAVIPAKYKSSYGVSELGNNSQVPRLGWRGLLIRLTEIRKKLLRILVKDRFVLVM